MDQNRPSTCQRFIVNFTKFLCLLCGVDARSEHSTNSGLRHAQCPSLRKHGMFILRLLISMQLLISAFENIISQYSRSSRHTSSTDVLLIAFSLIYPVVQLQCSRCLWIHDKFLRDFIGNPLHPPHLDSLRTICYIMCWAWFTALDITCGILDVSGAQRNGQWGAKSMLKLLGLHGRQCQYLVFILYSEYQAALRGRLARLQTSLNVAERAEILKEKYVVRNMTATVNKIFSTTFALLHVKVFIHLYLYLSECFLDSEQKRGPWILHLGSFFQFMILYDLASNGSRIINSCRETAFRFLVRTPQVETNKNVLSWSNVHQIISYDEMQDSLTVLHCSTFSKKSLFSHMVVVNTCIAVLLQFDYRILVKLDADMQRFKSHGDQILTRPGSSFRA